ncbi:MAG: DUF1259 domain-containing protein [Acidobacteria bacterium]|nr:DUF1259 domain-containing protein [Acidobacteriota bacterium]MCI0718619.1 DUF1259 domain-containing protein [Acidobacteriota bacterium]
MLSLARSFILLLLLSVPCVLQAQTRSIGFNTKMIEDIIGVKGTANTEERVFKVSFPRTDVPVTVDGWVMKPFMGLTSWAAFRKGVEKESMVMGDLVLFEDEVNPVMSVALENGLNVTALHNHFFYDNPKVYFMHIGGDGGFQTFATAVKKTQDKIKEIRAVHPQPMKGFPGAPLPAGSSIDGREIEKTLGYSGQANSGMFKVVIGRRATMPCGCDAAKEMGVNSWAAFAGSRENAFVDGDFSVLESELQDVLKTLRSGGINIVAIHHHMTDEKPRYLFLHYWGKGPVSQLVKVLRSALDKTKHE